MLALGASGMLAAAADCGGKAVIDPVSDGTGGAGGEGEIVTVASSSSITSSSSSTTTTTSSSTTTSSITSSSSTGGAPPIPPLVDNDLGTVSEGQTVSFDLPDEALGLTAYAQAPSNLASIGIETVTAPDMVNLVEGFSIAGTNAFYLRFGVQSLAVPQTDDPQAMPLLGGSWSFTVGAQGPLPSADVKVWYRQTIDGQFHGGAIDVNVFRVPNVASDGYLQQLVASAFSGWAGLTLGTVNILPLGSQYSVATLDNYVPLQLETTGAPGKPVINLMAVSMIDISDDPMVQVLGFSPGAPGLPLENGTMQSALVMMITGDAGIDRTVLRHEAGHFAGLFHTSEIQPAGNTDKLADTAQCADVAALFEDCPDFDNLMFPYAIPSSPMLMSLKQIEVVRASAIYRGAVEPGGGFAAPLDQQMMAAVAPPVDGDAPQADSDLVEAVGDVVRQAAGGGWRRHLSSATAATFLEALWCGTGETGAPYARLAQLGVQPDELLAVGLDPSAPAYVRHRALAAMGRLAPSPHGIDVLEGLAADRTEPRLVRLGALDGLSAVAPRRLAALDLLRDADVAVAQLAARR